MKSFWSGLILAGALMSSLWLAGLVQQLAVATPDSRWVFDAWQHKLAAARQVTVPKVLVVAGSSALFGIDSGQLQAYWGRPVINLGVNAGLGLPYILETSKRVARAGDIILMPMEYALYLDDGSPNAQVIDYVLARDADYWRRLSLLQRASFAWGLSVPRWLQGLQHLPDPAVSSGQYGAHHLDVRGDQTHSAPADLTPASTAAVQAAKSWHYAARAAKEKGGWALLAAYAAWARQTGVCVVALPSALLHHAAYDDDAQEVAFYTGVPDRVRSTGIAYVGQPRDFMYPPTWFFDTDHHLQDWARVRHTARLIALLELDLLRHCPTRPISHE